MTAELKMNRAPPHVDELYQDLLGSFEDLSDDQKLEYAVLMLVTLSNQIGDRKVVSEAIRLCRHVVRNGP